MKIISVSSYFIPVDKHISCSQDQLAYPEFPFVLKFCKIFECKCLEICFQISIKSINSLRLIESIGRLRIYSTHLIIPFIRISSSIFDSLRCEQIE